MSLRSARRVLLTAALATVALAVVAGPASAASHRVNARWEVLATDLSPGGAFVDTVLSTGAPFGRTQIVTRTPRSQKHDDIKTPAFEGKNRAGTFRGHLTVKKSYLRTTATSQLSKYEGTGRFEGGTGAYRGATGRITRIFGRVLCARSGCDGYLTVVGTIRF